MDGHGDISIIISPLQDITLTVKPSIVHLSSYNHGKEFGPVKAVLFIQEYRETERANSEKSYQ